MRIAPALVVVGALALGACASPSDVRSTESAANGTDDRLPAVDELATTTTITTTTTMPEVSETLPGTRPVDFGSQVLLASDLPGWNVVPPVDVPGEPSWQASDCPDMTTAWSATGRPGIRSRGTNGRASFRNTAVDFTSDDEAGDVLDAVERVWTECTQFETELGTFWSEPIDVPSASLRTAGIVIGNVDIPGWAFAYWQIDATVVILEVEGDEMWTFLHPLLSTLSARLDGAPTPMLDSATTTATTGVEQPRNLPVLVPATLPPAGLPTTTSTTSPQPDRFPPANAEWTKHRLAHLAPVPGDIGPGWVYDDGRRIEAEPADPDDAIEGCDAPVPPNLDGFEVGYQQTRSESQLSIMVGDGTAAEAQIWIDAFRKLAACELDVSDPNGAFDVVVGTVDGVDDAVIITAEWDFGTGETYLHVIAATRVGGTTLAAFSADMVVDERTADAAVARVRHVLATMLAAR